MDTTMVKCSVDNCEFWAEGNNCAADTIMIEVNAHAEKPLPEGKGAEQYDTRHHDQAKGVTDTCCHTFREKTH
ncbi:DUF1540 domain-containing protein [Paenibacillus sp. HJGM_3]|uniref:DUF1540 domain-containing protein n=1 Tax=Paenibacillus sp. HJGM_3 TaxID=3379816 RepID=UPI00385DCA56